MGRRTTSFSDAAKSLGMSRSDIAARVEWLKRHAGLGKIAANDVEIDVVSGDVYLLPSREPIGNLRDATPK